MASKNSSSSDTLSPSSTLTPTNSKANISTPNSPKPPSSSTNNSSIAVSLKKESNKPKASNCPLDAIQSGKRKNKAKSSTLRPSILSSFPHWIEPFKLPKSYYKKTKSSPGKSLFCLSCLKCFPKSAISVWQLMRKRKSTINLIFNIWTNGMLIHRKTANSGKIIFWTNSTTNKSYTNKRKAPVTWKFLRRFSRRLWKVARTVLKGRWGR